MTSPSFALKENQAPLEAPAANSRTPLFWWKVAAMVVVLGLTPLPFIWPLIGVVDGAIPSGTWLLMQISAWANITILFYHYLAPAHPKFMMIPWRRWVLRTHIISGTTELFAGIAALFFTKHPAAGMVMGIAALCFHVPSAILQTPIVFGAKAIMTPAYILCVLLHAFCAVNLLMHPESTFWVANTFLIFNIYVWCRLYFYIFDALKLFSTMKYTIAILAAGCTLVPAVVGPLSFLAIIFFVIVYAVLYRGFFITSAAEHADFVREKARDAALSPEMMALWDRPLSPAENERESRKYFEMLDAGKTGYLKPAALEFAFSAEQMPATLIGDFLRKRVGTDQVNFDQFKTHIWSIDAVRQRARRVTATRQAKSERDRAELVFRQLDVKGSGQIEKSVLGLLLSEWGLPKSEAERYLRQVDGNGDGQIDFEDFFTKMRPVWRFIYFDIYEAEAAGEETDMLKRMFTSNKEAALEKKMTRTVQEDLLGKVPFLADADAILVQDLGSSLVSATYPKGTVLFTEGAEGDKFYVIESGSVRISKGGEVIAILGAGGAFGEGSLFSSERRSATITTSETSVIHALSRSSFEFVLGRHPGVRDQLANIHQQRVTIAVKRTLTSRLLGKVQFLADTDETVIDAIAGIMQPTQVPAGTRIIAEGERSERFFLIEEGKVQVLRGPTIVAELGAGGCFGEGALLAKTAHSASVVAAEDTKLLAITKEKFDVILASFPGIQSRMIALHLERRGPTAAPFMVANG